ncbi:MAG: PAS domain S-box protein [Acidobacteriota bacterium]
MTNWTNVALFAQIACFSIIVLLYSFIFSKHRKRFLLFWTFAWLSHTLRSVAMLADIHFGPSPLLLMAEQLLVVATGALALPGSLLSGGLAARSWFFPAPAAAALWAAIAVGLAMPAPWFRIPTALFFTGSLLMGGYAYFTRSPAASLGGRLAGLALSLWGLNHLICSFPRQPDWFAHWGFLTEAGLSLLSACAVIMAYFEGMQDELGRSEDRFRVLFHSHDAPFLLIEPHSGAIVDANEGAVDFYGYSRQELMEMNISQINATPPEEIAAMRNAALEKRRKHFVFPHRIKSGEVRIVEVYSSPVEVAGRDLLFSVLHDITERRRAEAELKNSRRRLADILSWKESIINNSAVGILVLTGGRVITEVNRGFLDMFGYTPEELIGKSVEMIHVNHQTFRAFARRYQNDSVEPRITAIQWRLRRKNGGIFWGELAGTAIDPQDISKGVVWIILDIAHRKETENSLRRNEERLRVIADNTYDWEYWRAPDGKYVWVSPSCERVTGYSPKEFTEFPQDKIRELIHPDDRRIWDEHLLEADCQVHGHRKLDFRLTRRDGEIIWIAHTCKPIFRSDGVLLGRRGCNRDITEHKIMEQAMTFLATSGSGQSGRDFFRSLARYLAETLRMDFVSIDRLDDDGLTARSLAVHCDGRYEENASYTLKGTPFGELAGKAVCCFPRGVRTLFPGHEMLEALAAESYVGVTLWDAQGNPSGLISVIGRRPLENPRIAESILHLAEGRASGELLRLNAQESVAASLREKEVLLREIHHRVKNNLQIVSSLLSLQEQGLDNADSLKVLAESRGRVMSMALIHDQLYRSRDFSLIDVGDYLRELLPRLISSFKGNRDIGLRLDVPPISLSLDLAIPFGLIMNELVTNALKHAFPDRDSGTVEVSASWEDGMATMTVQDDGVGLSPDFDLNAVTSLGLQIVTMLAGQLHGTLSAGVDSGKTMFMLRYPLDKTALH